MVKTPDQNFESNDGAGQQVEQHALSGEIKVNELFMEVFLPFKNSIDEASEITNLDYDTEHRDFAFLVLSHQSIGLIYEDIDIEKAIYHIQEAVKIAYNTGNALLLEQRFR